MVLENICFFDFDFFDFDFKNTKNEVLYIDTIYNPLETKTLRYLKDEGKKVFTMNGHRGQFVISFPDEDIIIVRQGEDNEKGGDGTGDLFQYISEGYKLATAIE